MRLHRRQRTWLSGWLVVVLLATQLATAAYACPVVPGGVAAARASQANVALPLCLTPGGGNVEDISWGCSVVMAAMPGCDGNMAGAMDPDQPQLCQAHCQQGSQTVHPTPSSDAPATPVLVAVLDWAAAALMGAQPACRASVITSGPTPPGAPPLYLSLLVLRN